MLTLQLGRARINLALPPDVLAAGLPSFLQRLPGEILPEFTADLALDQLDRAPAGASDVTRRFGLGPARLTRDGESWRLFTRLPKGPARPDDLAVTAVIPAIFLVLAHHGVTPVHAAAVTHAGRAILIAGRSGSGKSTFAQLMTLQGCKFLADDRVLLWREDNSWLVTPSFERPNPFCRWVGRTPESGPRPARPEIAYGEHAPLATLLFPEIRAGAESGLDPATAAQAHALLATFSAGEGWDAPLMVSLSNHDPSTKLGMSVAPPLVLSEAELARPSRSIILRQAQDERSDTALAARISPAVPAWRLTLGRAVSTLVDQILAASA